MHDLERLWRRIFDAFAIRDVLDIGAEKGSTISMWLTFGAQSVHAVEPVPENVERLVERFGHDRRVTLHRCGVSNRASVAPALNVFNVWSLLPESSTVLERAIAFHDTPPFAVEFTTIDALAEAHALAPGLVKIDVDGYEARALCGAERLVDRCRPIMLFELSYLPFFVGDCCECMIRWIYDHGYVVADADLAKTYGDARAVMRIFPWDTSFDVFLLPAEHVGRAVALRSQ